MAHCIKGKCVSDSVDFQSSECPNGEVIRCAEFGPGNGPSKAKENIVNNGEGH